MHRTTQLIRKARPLSFVDPSGYNCEAPEGMSDDEASDYITRCNDAYDSGGWGAIRENERWCASLDLDCQQRNHQQTLASAIDALVAAGITPGLYEAILDNNGRMPNLPTLAGGEASGVMVTASRLGGSARYAWYTYTGLAPGTTRHIETTLPGGGTGWVAGGLSGEGAGASTSAGRAGEGVSPLSGWAGAAAILPSAGSDLLRLQSRLATSASQEAAALRGFRAFDRVAIPLVLLDAGANAYLSYQLAGVDNWAALEAGLNAAIPFGTLFAPLGVGVAISGACAYSNCGAAIVSVIRH